MARHPDEISVEFGLEFTADTSAILASAAATANVAVHPHLEGATGGA